MPKTIDIKYIDVPNICFSLTDKDDKREKKLSKQRIKRGFDDSETWCLTTTICSFVLPRLKRFKKIDAGHPMRLTAKEWHSILNKIIVALELIIRNDGAWVFNEKEQKQVEKGLDLFREWFFSLWW
jgi:hypothetical protein